MDTIIRVGYATLGSLALVLGLIGLVLPVLPSTVFLIVAAWAFARSVPAVHRWLHSNPWSGAALRRWELERCLPILARRIALATLGVSGLASALTLAHRPGLVAALLSVLVAVAYYLHTRAICAADPADG